MAAGGKFSRRFAKCEERNQFSGRAGYFEIRGTKPIYRYVYSLQSVERVGAAKIAQPLLPVAVRHGAMGDVPRAEVAAVL